MHAGGNKGVYDLDSVEIGEFTENEPEIKVFFSVEFLIF